jgi:hypothetical protein
MEKRFLQKLILAMETEEHDMAMKIYDQAVVVSYPCVTAHLINANFHAGMLYPVSRIIKMHGSMTICLNEVIVKDYLTPRCKILAKAMRECPELDVLNYEKFVVQ